MSLVQSQPLPSTARRSTRLRGRANLVVERDAALIAIAAGAVARLSPASPTGHAFIDPLLVAVAVAAVVYAAASAPWWSLAVAAAASVTIAADPLLIAAGCLSGGLALVIGWRQRNQPQLRATSAALTCLVAAHAELDGSFGVSAAVAIGTGLLLLTAGLRRRPQRIRRVAVRTIVGVAGFAAIATVAFLAEAAAAKSLLVDGKHEAELAVAAVERGAYSEAAGHFGRASELLGSAEGHLNRPWARLGSLVPVVAQHHHAATELSGEAARAAATAAAAAALVDPETMRVEGGVIDLAAVAALTEPIDDLDAALRQMADSTHDVDSRWLLPVVRDELSELALELDENVVRVGLASDAVDLAPAMLGADAPRVYLVLFTTPAEARGFGGFIGNYAELTIDGGQIEMTEFGRVSDLERLGQAIGIRLEGPAEFLRRYGTFGYNTDGNGLVGSAPWRNLTMSPDFPTVATVAADMYEQLSGRAIDGVITVDPFVLSALLGYTGPIELSTVDFTLDASNAANYILVDQYRVAGDHFDRIDALDEAARLTVEQLLSGAMPAPTTLADDLGPLAASGRLAVWTNVGAEQDLLRRTGLLGEIPDLDGANGWAVTVTNAGGSKIDSFLTRDFQYRAATGDDGTTSATLDVTLGNTAPATGLPDYVIGNVIGMPTGTSRLYVSFYSALPLEAAELDGDPTALTEAREAGWYVYSGYVRLPSGESATFALTFDGTVTDPATVVTWTQPLVIPPTIH